MTTSDDTTTHAIPQLIADVDSEIVASPLTAMHAATATPGDAMHRPIGADDAPHAAPHTEPRILPPLTSPPHTGGSGGSD